VKEAVYQLSHIEALDRGIKHLGTLRDERRRTAKSKNGEVDRYRKKLAGKHEEQRDIEHDKATVEQRLRAKQRALQEVEDDMGVASDPTVMKLRTRRERLEAEIERVEDAQAALEETLNEHLVTAGTILFASDALDDATTQLEQLDAQGHLPPDIRRSFLTARLEEDTCICGCDLEKHPQRRQAVKTLRDETPNISERTIDASYAFPQTQAAGVESFQALRATRKELRDNQQTKLQLEQDREELSQELRGKDIPEDVDLEALDEQREQLRAELRRLQNKNGRFEERLEAKKAEVEAAKERVETELAKESRSQELMEEVEFYKRARARLQSIKASLMAEVRSDIESSLDAYYNELTWKSETYELSLADDFRIHIEGPDSLRQVERLSAGETEILALSFIAALTEVSGFDAPVLIDTPLGRIDKAHRGAIARKLPEYLAGHQVTFLFTDSEYDDVVEPILDGNLAKTHKLENDNRVTDVDNVTT
jgi:DNA sulfur modification protein DndD